CWRWYPSPLYAMHQGLLQPIAIPSLATERIRNGGFALIKPSSLTARVSLDLALIALISLCAPARGALAQEQLLIQPRLPVRVTGLPSGEPKKELRKVPRHTQDAEALANLKAQHKAGGDPTLTEAVADLSLAPPSVFGKAPGIQQGQAGGFIPPDTQIAAGPQHIVEAVNLAVRVWSKGSPPVVIGSFDLGGFFGVDDALLSDPKVRFDAQSNRWYIAAISFPAPTGAWHLAVSTSDDPTGDFAIYTISSASGTFPDFTAMGMSDDKVVLSGNAFRTRGPGQFTGTEYAVLSKADLVAAGPAHSQFFGPPQGLFTIQPATTLPSTTGSTTTLYMAAVVSNSSTTMLVWSLTGVPGVGNGVQVSTTTLQIPTLSSP